MNESQAELLKDHAEMERLLKLLAQAVDSNDASDELQRLWSQVEGIIVDHIRTEEHEFFVLVGPAHRAEVEGLRADHQRIRSSLAALGVELELHALRKPEIDALIQLLRDHAEREDATLYNWLSQRPDPTMAKTVHRMLLRRHSGQQKAG